MTSAPGQQPLGGDDVDAAAATILGAGDVVVLTGAGISTDSGIADFRGPRGVWTRDPEAERLATISSYLASSSVRVRSWQARATSGLWAAEPNAGHEALVRLARLGRLELLVTQNVDGLHQRAGTDPERLVEIHGNVREHVCVGCGARGPVEEIILRLEAGEEDPACERCGGIVKAATVMFGESLVEADVARSFAAATDCDLLLCIGTTLTVHPVADMVPTAVAAGAALVIVNAQPTAFDHVADVVLRSPISEVLPAVVDAVAVGMPGLAE